MHLSWDIVLTGAFVGFTVGLTGMGGGALMTPILVLLLGVAPGTAVSSDLVASFFMRPVAGFVHLRRHNADLRIVALLGIGSLPSAFFGAWLLHHMAHGFALERDVKIALGAALLLAVAGIAARACADRKRPVTQPEGKVRVRPLPTLLVGAVGGVVVGATSVGSGSLMIVALAFVYPGLAMRELVGNDTLQAIPLLGSAAIGQVLFGRVDAGVTASVLLGAVPTVYLGSRLASCAPTSLLRPIVVLALLVSALDLLGAGSLVLAAVLTGGGIVGGVMLWRAARAEGGSSGLARLWRAPGRAREAGGHVRLPADRRAARLS